MSIFGDLTVSIKKVLFPERLHSLTPIQKRYFNDRHRFIVVSAGRRSRKTLIARRKLLIEALSNPESKYIHAAPTHQQAKLIFWKGLKQHTYYFRKRKSDSELTITLKNNTIIQVVGLDKPERIEGQSDVPIRGIHITEFANTKPDAWGEHIRPILADTKGWAILDGVPEGFNHYYDIALRAAGGTIPVTIPKYGAFGQNSEWAFYSWFSADVLDKNELENIREETDEKTFKQEYEGSFVSMEGLAYYAFSDKNIKHCKYDPNLRIAIGMDFNVDPMCAVVGHIYPDRFEQFDEIILRNSNTDEMCQHLIRKYNLRKNNSFLDVTVFPDATGGARKTSASLTDLQILRHYGFRLKVPKMNPYQTDRVNVVNSACNPLSGLPKYYVDPKCKKTIDDLGQVRRLADGRLDKTQEKEGLPRVHITDALGYLIYYSFPIIEKKGFYA